jgi:hypothetical protein
MGEIGDIISDFFGKIGKKETPKEDITDIFRDKYTAGLALKLTALSSGFDIIEAESNAEFIRALKRMDAIPRKRTFINRANEKMNVFNEANWDKVVTSSVENIEDTVKQLNELKTKEFVYRDDQEFGKYEIDYIGIAREFTEMLDRDCFGDAMVRKRESMFAKIYFKNNTEPVRRLKGLCDECYDRIITNDWDDIVWSENQNIDDEKILKMKRTFDIMAEECCKYYGRDESKITYFPAEFIRDGK